MAIINKGFSNLVIGQYSVSKSFIFRLLNKNEKCMKGLDNQTSSFNVLKREGKQFRNFAYSIFSWLVLRK